MPTIPFDNRYGYQIMVLLLERYLCNSNFYGVSSKSALLTLTNSLNLSDNGFTDYISVCTF